MCDLLIYWFMAGWCSADWFLCQFPRACRCWCSDRNTRCEGDLKNCQQMSRGGSRDGHKFGIIFHSERRISMVLKLYNFKSQDLRSFNMKNLKVPSITKYYKQRLQKSIKTSMFVLFSHFLTDVWSFEHFFKLILFA